MGDSLYELSSLHAAAHHTASDGRNDASDDARNDGPHAAATDGRADGAGAIVEPEAANAANAAGSATIGVTSLRLECSLLRSIRLR
jgi:hypothetical protein